MFLCDCEDVAEAGTPDLLPVLSFLVGIKGFKGDQ